MPFRLPSPFRVFKRNGTSTRLFHRCSSGTRLAALVATIFEPRAHRRWFVSRSRPSHVAGEHRLASFLVSVSGRCACTVLQIPEWDSGNGVTVAVQKVRAVFWTRDCMVVGCGQSLHAKRFSETCRERMSALPSWPARHAHLSGSTNSVRALTTYKSRGLFRVVTAHVAPDQVSTPIMARKAPSNLGKLISEKEKRVERGGRTRARGTLQASKMKHLEFVYL